MRQLAIWVYKGRLTQCPNRSASHLNCRNQYTCMYFWRPMLPVTDANSIASLCISVPPNNRDTTETNSSWKKPNIGHSLAEWVCVMYYHIWYATSIGPIEWNTYIVYVIGRLGFCISFSNNVYAVGQLHFPSLCRWWCGCGDIAICWIVGDSSNCLSMHICHRCCRRLSPHTSSQYASISYVHS